MDADALATSPAAAGPAGPGFETKLCAYYLLGLLAQSAQRLRGMLNAEADQNAREQTHEQREHWARAGPSGGLGRGYRDRPGVRPPRLRRGGAASVSAVASAAVSVGTAKPKR